MTFENHMFHITGKQNVIWKSYVSHNWHSKWNAQCTSSLLKYFLGVLSRIQYPVSMIVQYPVSSIQYPWLSSIQYPVSVIVQYPVSSIHDCPVSSIQHPWLSSFCITEWEISLLYCARYFWLEKHTKNYQRY